MTGAWLARTRWRRRGAWLWPAFVLLTLLDGVLGHLLPIAGDSQAVFGAALVACFANLLGVILLTRPLAALIRRRHDDLPTVVARDYAGTAVVSAIAVVLATVGLIHHDAISRDRSAMREAIARAEAWIGDHAPDPFKRNMQRVSAFAIQPGSIYRACVPNPSATKTYCVVVNTTLPFAGSVRFDGYEPNSLFADGVG